MSTPAWKAYNELAWVDTVLASPEECAVEAELYVRVIREHCRSAPATLLHLGCGAGAHDFTFKRQLAVTGVDVSPGMLEIARALNPEVTYVCGDMRTLELGRRFDVVAIPDSIDYMVTLPDLRATLETASRHLNPGGALLVVANTRDEFRENNFVYAGSRDDTEVTVFENNRVCEDGARYEATLVYLIRRRGRLSIETEVHTLGLFPRATWLELLAGAGLEVVSESRSGGFEKYLVHDGTYPRTLFIGRRAP